MAEKNVFADKIAESIAKLGSSYGIAKDEIMVIHTDNSGDVRKSDWRVYGKKPVMWTIRKTRSK